MNTLAVVGTLAALYFILDFISGTRSAVDGLKVYVTHPSRLRISGGMILLDVMVNIDNNSSHSLPIQALQVSAFSKSGNAWREFASSSPTLSNIIIKPFATTRFPVPMQTSLFNAGTELYNLLLNRGSGQFKFSVAPTFMGFRIPPVETGVFEFNAGSFVGEKA